MDKFAQKRSLLNRLQEMGNVSGRSAETFFRPELKRVMNVLIDTDDVVRSTLAGQKIGKASPEDPVSAKDLLKEAKSFINRREYLSAIANLGRFHKKMFDAAEVLKGLDLNVSSLHHKFLFNKLPSNHREQLEDMRSRFASDQSNYFIKEAGIMDFFHNIGTQRGRALAAWEKRYPKVVAKIRDGAVAQLEASQNLLADTLSLLKEMATNRAARNIDAYLENSKQLISAVNKYDTGKNGFRGYYNDVVKPYLDKQAEIEAQEKTTSSTTDTVNNMLTDQSGKNLQQSGLVEAPTGSESEPSMMVSPSTDPDVEVNVNAPTSLPQPPPVPGSMPLPRFSPTIPPTVPSLPTINTPVKAPEGFKSDEVAQELFGPKKDAYHAFLDSLQVFGNENPLVLATHISKYAKSIQANQPDVAIKLFKIAKSLRG